jgi:hypothetical protein
MSWGPQYDSLGVPSLTYVRDKGFWGDFQYFIKRAAAGMSTFSLKGGLYERAQKKYNLSEGKKLFTYPFFERQKLDAQVLAPHPPTHVHTFSTETM